jgi:hypothetical protein
MYVEGRCHLLRVRLVELGVDERREQREGQSEGHGLVSRLQRLHMIACKGVEGAKGFFSIASCGPVHRAMCAGGIADMPRGGECEGLL